MEYYGLRITYNRDIFCIWVADESGDRQRKPRASSLAVAGTAGIH